MWKTDFRPMGSRLALSFFISLAMTFPCGLFAGQFYTNWAAAHFSDTPSAGGLLGDPDHDGEANLIEFAFGTDPRAADSVSRLVTPLRGGPVGTNNEFAIEILEQEGRQPGVQIDFYASATLTNWFRPWWLRVPTNSHPSDPPGSTRELLTTRMPGTRAWFIRPAARLIDAGPGPAAYYVATNGDDNNPGTIDQPLATLTTAGSLAQPGDLIYVRGGTYIRSDYEILFSSGTPAQPIRLRAYPGENPVFDFSAETFSPNSFGLFLYGNEWQVYGLEIFGAGDNGVLVYGNSNLIERCVIHDCRDTGLQIYTDSGSNLILNCDSYRNFDTGTHGENADGFGAKFEVGVSNVFRGCRAWENADDGWDLWMSSNTVVLDNCWSFQNGTNVMGDPLYTGDGNGFKLGGNGVAGPHIITRCVAFGNRHSGYDQNNNPAPQSLDQNTAWGNLVYNFNLNHGGVVTSIHVLRNNLSLGGTVQVQANAIQLSNSWQIITAASTNDVLSIDTSFAQAQRRDDGSLSESPFLRPIPGGRLIDTGMNLGSPFFGTAPDLGAFESPAW